MDPKHETTAGVAQVHLDNEQYSLSVAEVLDLQRSTLLPLHRNKGLIKLYLALVPGVLMVSATQGYEGSMLNGLQSLITFEDYFRPSSALSGLINSSYFIGALFSFPIAPVLADTWGRKTILYIGCITMLIATALQGAAQNLAMFVVARILMGFAGFLACNGAPILVAELSHPRHRKFLTGLYNPLYYLGAIAAAWTTYGTFAIDSTYAWRIPSYLQGVWGLLNIAFLWMVPESPRWFVSKGRVDEAKQVLASAHTNGDTEDPLIAAEMSEIIESFRKGEVAKQSSWKELFATAPHRRRLFILIFIGQAMNFSGNGLVSYYLSRILTNIGITSQRSQTLINGILTIVSFFASVAAAWASGWVRRRTQFMTSVGCMFISFLSVTIATSIQAKDAGNKSASIATIFFVFLFMCGYNWAFSPLAYSYPAEILPFNIRVTGVATVNVVCALAGAFNTFVNPIAMADIAWKYYIVYVVWLAVEFMVIYLVFPETLGHGLEEVAAILDEDTFFVSHEMRRKTQIAVADGRTITSS